MFVILAMRSQASRDVERRGSKLIWVNISALNKFLVKSCHANKVPLKGVDLSACFEPSSRNIESSNDGLWLTKWQRHTNLTLYGYRRSNVNKFLMPRTWSPGDPNVLAVTRFVEANLAWLFRIGNLSMKIFLERLVALRSWASIEKTFNRFTCRWIHPKKLT